MRRIVLVLLLLVVFVVAGYMLLRPKGGKARAKSKSAFADTSEYGAAPTSGAKAVRPAGSKRARAGRVAGALKPTTKAERRAQIKKIKVEERRRKKALKQQEREKRRMLKSASARGGRRSSRSKGAGLYVLKAIILLGNESYVLVDGRKARVGDVVMGRKVVGIGQDRIEIEAFGKRSTVRVGESLMPPAYNPTGKKK